MKIALIGCGTMGTALAKRLSQQHEIFLYDHHIEKSKGLEKQGFGISYSTLTEACRNSEMMILAIKPKNLKEVATEMVKEVQKPQILVSILAATSISNLEKMFPHHMIIRMMLNLALEYEKSAIALTPSKQIDDQVLQNISRIFAPLGTFYWISEEKMSAFSTLAGSGPAFVFAFVEAMIEAGIAMGISPHEAKEWIITMLEGSTAMLRHTDMHPAALRWNVASPKGTTIAGLRVLEKHAMRSAILESFLATFKESDSKD